MKIKKVMVMLASLVLVFGMNTRVEAVVLNAGSDSEIVMAAENEMLKRQ